MKKNVKVLGLDMEATAVNIGFAIDNSGYSDKEIAEMMGLTVQSINKWRHGYCIPDMENLFILSRILEMPVDDFLVPREGRTVA